MYVDKSYVDGIGKEIVVMLDVLVEIGVFVVFMCVGVDGKLLYLEKWVLFKGDSMVIVVV